MTLFWGEIRSVGFRTRVRSTSHRSQGKSVHDAHLSKNSLILNSNFAVNSEIRKTPPNPGVFGRTSPYVALGLGFHRAFKTRFHAKCRYT